MSVRATLFGLALESELPLAGVADDPRVDPRLRVVGAARAAVLGDFTDAQTLTERRDGRGAHVLRIAHSDAHGTLIVARGWGAFAVDPAVAHVRCAPVRVAGWRWQRYLIAQVLPWAAVLTGLEVLHASAVEHDGAAVAFTGASQAGKSTLAAAWLARGARLVADDVVAVEAPGDQPVVHPGPGVLSVRTGSGAALGRRLGADEHGERVAVARAPGPLPLGALVLLERTAAARGVAVERLVAPDPRLLLGATFNAALRTPERLVRQLDIMGAIARTVPVLRARSGLDVAPDAIVDAVAGALG